MTKLKAQVEFFNEPFDPADGCEAIVAVGEDGEYFFIKKPNIFCFDVEPAPQDNGFGDYYDLPAGVYRMKFKFNEYKDWESGIVDDWDFTPIETELLYKVE